MWLSAIGCRLSANHKVAESCQLIVAGKLCLRPIALGQRECLADSRKLTPTATEHTRGKLVKGLKHVCCAKSISGRN